MKKDKSISNFKFDLATITATYLNIGNIKYAPGTFGSVATFPLFLIINFVLLKIFDVRTLCQLAISYGIVLCLLLMAAFWSVKIYIGTNKKDDPQEVVVDEVAGQTIAFMMPTLLASYYFVYLMPKIDYSYTFAIVMTLILIVAPMIFFRLFDILKPGLVGYYDNKVEGVKGIIMDDVIAGIYAGLVVSLILSIFLLSIATL